MPRVFSLEQYIEQGKREYSPHRESSWHNKSLWQESSRHQFFCWRDFPHCKNVIIYITIIVTSHFFDDDKNFLSIKNLFFLHDKDILVTTFFIMGLCSFFRWITTSYWGESQHKEYFAPRRYSPERIFYAEKIPIINNIRLVTFPAQFIFYCQGEQPHHKYFVDENFLGINFLLPWNFSSGILTPMCVSFMN